MSELAPYLRYVHLLAASVWVGGLIVLAALVPALRKVGASRDQLRAAARRFSHVSWVAMAVAVATGVGQVFALGIPWTYGRLHLKIGMVALAILIAGFHQVTARKSSAAARGVVQLLVMLASLGIVAAAVAL